MRSYRDLIAWQRAMEVACDVYRATEELPRTERFELGRQMRRAAVSIPSNIAEGYGRQSTRDYLKHLRIARGSLAELATQIELSCELSLLTPDAQLHDLLREEERLLQALIKSLQRREALRH